MRIDPSGPRGASFSVVPSPPSFTGVDAIETSGAAAVDVPPPTTLDDLDIRRTLDHVLTVQAAQGQIWHGFGVLHRYLLLLMDFDCSLAFRKKKKGVHIGCFWHTLYLFLFLGGEFIFDWLELVEFLDCI